MIEHDDSAIPSVEGGKLIQLKLNVHMPFALEVLLLGYFSWLSPIMFFI